MIRFYKYFKDISWGWIDFILKMNTDSFFLNVALTLCYTVHLM